MPEKTESVSASAAYEQRLEEAGRKFGCDRCGRSKGEHITDDRGRLHCSGSRGMWRVSPNWTDGGHAVTAEFHHGTLSLRLVCPDEGCKPPACGCQGEEYIEREPDPKCPRCHGTGSDPSVPCWLRLAFDEYDDIEEATPWALSFTFERPVPILTCGGWDDFEWRPIAVPEGEGR